MQGSNELLYFRPNLYRKQFGTETSLAVPREIVCPVFPIEPVFVSPKSHSDTVYEVDGIGHIIHMGK